MGDWIRRMGAWRNLRALMALGLGWGAFGLGFLELQHWARAGLDKCQ